MRSPPYEGAGHPNPAPSKAAPLQSTTNGWKPITTAEAIVARLTERGCAPKRIRHRGVAMWRAVCLFDDPRNVGRCGYFIVREGEHGEALVSNGCDHSVSEIVCDLLGVLPDPMWKGRGAA